ncbi:MAG TPA: hypothetical protein VEQ66_00175 [Propionibacteriaceae bacterium]|nr:hypothetical protein [Propionibacteriaceae bacterium]
MTNRLDDAAFAQFASDQRESLLGAAYLMYARLGRAEDVVEAALASLYRTWPGAEPGQRVLSAILLCHPGRLVQPWRHVDQFELVDVTDEPPPAGVVADLASLDDDTRRVVILRQFLELPPAQTAVVLGLPLARVAQLAENGVRQLVEQDPDRADEQRLAAQLRGATWGIRMAARGSGTSDLHNGRLLVRRTLLRRGLVVVAGLLTVLLVVTQSPTSRTLAEAPVSSTSTAAVSVLSARAACDVAQPPCRLEVLRDWRTEMTEIIRSHLDPGQVYFSGYADSTKGLYASEAFWRGQGGALSLDVVPRGSGATEIYLQVATSRSFAVRCGSLTFHTCTRRNFPEGFTYALTRTTTPAEGTEVQLALGTVEVVTLVARNTSSGPELEVTSADLRGLATDPRLRLPPR